MKKTLLAALLAAAVAGRRCGGGDDGAAAGDLAGAGEREPVGRRLHRLPAAARRLDGRHARAGRHERRRPARRRHERADQGRLKTREGGGRARRPYASRAMRTLHALTGAVRGRSFFGRARSLRGPSRSRRRATTRSSRCCRPAPATAARTASCASASPHGPTTPRSPLAVARRYLEQARESGDPRFAGLALAALRAWPDANAARRTTCC